MLVLAGELHLVRVVEMKDRRTGTKVHAAEGVATAMREAGRRGHVDLGTVPSVPFRLIPFQGFR